MAAVDMPEDDQPKKGSRLPLILGLVLALAGGGGGFFAVSSGLILAPAEDAASEDGHNAAAAADPVSEIAPVAFVALDPLVISLPDTGANRLLRFTAQLEVAPEHLVEVETLKPRVVDVLNGYLRAVSIAELEDPTILSRLRGQMLRRVQVVAGQGRVRDLLIMEFVLN